MHSIDPQEFWTQLNHPEEMGAILPIPHGYTLSDVNFYFENGVFNDAGMAHIGPAVRVVIRKGD